MLSLKLLTLYCSLNSGIARPRTTGALLPEEGVDMPAAARHCLSSSSTPARAKMVLDRGREPDSVCKHVLFDLHSDLKHVESIFKTKKITVKI